MRPEFTKLQSRLLCTLQIIRRLLNFVIQFLTGRDNYAYTAHNGVMRRVFMIILTLDVFGVYAYMTTPSIYKNVHVVSAIMR